MMTVRATDDRASRSQHRTPEDSRRPERSCAACRERSTPDALIRWVRAPSGEVAPDLKGSAFGRGAWLHARPECLRKLPTALSRSFRASVTTTADEGLELLSAAGERRIALLLGEASRGRKVSLGSDPVSEAVETGAAQLVIVARDARAAATTTAVRRAVETGKARAWGTKSVLGRLLGRSEIGVLAVTDHRLARGLFDAIALAQLPGPPVDETAVETTGTLGAADDSSEDE